VTHSQMMKHMETVQSHHRKESILKELLKRMVGDLSAGPGSEMPTPMMNHWMRIYLQRLSSSSEQQSGTYATAATALAARHLRHCCRKIDRPLSLQGGDRRPCP
jgi:hypothetical protein